MSVITPNDVEVYHARQLATFMPRTERGRLWIEQQLRPQGWQAGYRGAYYTDRSEVENLREWMKREGLVTQIINPP